ncbi:MAG: hypothetical protein HGB27_01315 [Chlorobiaceae bacterium]|nr:hypothetical protein [Chlorobiaceae bacterium]
MKPICINNYCFDRVHIWVQYDWLVPQFVELVIEVFYPKNRAANGLVMFSHGFLIGNDLLFYPKKVAGALLNDNPLFGINPSSYYNYSEAIVEKNWAMGFVTAAHMQSALIPWVDLGGNPRVGQEAYAAASYLIKYGATDEFYKIDEHNRNQSFHDREILNRTRFMKGNNVIFAGHSVGGAHAQAAAVGFENLRKLGGKSFRPFNPVIYDREFIPAYSERMEKWNPEDRANPVGLLQLSPVDMNIPLIAPGMKPYRDILSETGIPELMVVGQCDCATLESSNPPSWSSTSGTPTQFTQLSSPESWSSVARIEKGAHCGYLTEKSELCKQADNPSKCKLCPGVETYKPNGAETAFTIDMFRRFIRLYPDAGGFQGTFEAWKQSDFMQWLNRESPDGTVRLVPFADGQYVDFAR